MILMNNHVGDNNDDDPIGDDGYQDEQAEQGDRVRLLGVPPSPLASHSRISLSATSHSSSSGSVEARSRTHSSFSIHSSRSRRPSRARSRTRHKEPLSVNVRVRWVPLRSLMRNTTHGLY